MHENRTYYNIIEANSLIPRLEHLFAELARVQHKVNNLSKRAFEFGFELNLDELQNVERSAHPVRRQIEERLVSLSDEYSEILYEISSLGVIIDDIDHGIVNFYSWLDGKEVFLSWQYGEPEVGHWHAVTENSIARRSLKKFVAYKPDEVSLH